MGLRAEEANAEIASLASFIVPCPPTFPPPSARPALAARPGRGGGARLELGESKGELVSWRSGLGAISDTAPACCEEREPWRAVDDTAPRGVLERALTELLGQPAPAPAARKRQRTAETKHQPKQWLPSCEREFLCTRCFFTGDSRRWEFDDTKVHQPKDGLRRHVAKVCKEKASETLFSGELISEGGERHFGLCVCSGPCTGGGED